MVDCKHYWICEENRQPTSKAKCIHCGEEAIFYNTLERALFKNFKIAETEINYDTFVSVPNRYRAGLGKIW